MKGRMENGVFNVRPENLDEAFALGALWQAWREKDPHALEPTGVVIQFPTPDDVPPRPRKRGGKRRVNNQRRRRRRTRATTPPAAIQPSRASGRGRPPRCPECLKPQRWVKGDQGPELVHRDEADINPCYEQRTQGGPK